MTVVLDQTRCIKCRRCANVCMSRVFSVADDGTVFPDPERVSRCYGCGHCSAVCPKAAITLDGVNPDTLTPVVDAPMSETQRDMLFGGRRSIRFFKSDPVDDALLHRAMDLVAYAPTGHNKRDVHWLIINGREKLVPLIGEVIEALQNSADPGYRKVAASMTKRDTLLFGAPCLAVAHTKPWLRGEADCVTAITYLDLILNSMGLGTCWNGRIMAAAAERSMHSLPIPEGHVVYGALTIGHPSITFQRLPKRTHTSLVWR